MSAILFFDIDRTLIINRFSSSIFRHLLGIIAPAAAKSTSELMQDVLAENNRRIQTDPDNILTMDWADIVEKLALNYDVILPESLDKLWLQAAAVSGIEVLDNAPVVLRQLKDSGYTLVIATKGLSKYQLPILEATGLRACFDDILAPDITGYLKTSPGFFDKFQQHNDRRIQIGDHYYDDVICPGRNGFSSILRAPIAALRTHDPFERPAYLKDYADQIEGYPEAGTDSRPDAVVLSLQEVPAVISRLAGAS